MERITEDQVNKWMSRGYLTLRCYAELMVQARNDEEDVENEKVC